MTPGYPELGSQPNVAAKINIRFRPIQKLGAEAKVSERVIEIWSSQLLRFTAEIIPTKIPKIEKRMVAPQAMRMLASARWAMREMTG